MNEPPEIAAFEAKYGKLPKGYRSKLLDVLTRGPKERESGLTLMALKAFPSSPMQKLLQELRKGS